MEQLVRHLQASPTPWHAAARMEKILLDQEFDVLTEDTLWSLKPGGRYIVQRQPGALIAFIVPDSPQDSNREGSPRVHLACTHTDSPGLKLKPHSCKRKSDHLVLDVEVYGSPLLSTWFDRDLGMAGQLTLVGPEGELRYILLDSNAPVAVLPSLAIHLHREANDGYKIRPHEDISPIFLHKNWDKFQEPSQAFQEWVFECLHAQYPDDDFQGWEAVSWDLSLYDLQPPGILGGDTGWITGGRLDNLLGCFTAVEALMSVATQGNDGLPVMPVLACFNHEESGSLSRVGAHGNFLSSVLGRLFPKPGQLDRVMSRSIMVSVDNAHGLHPNFADKHDGNNVPILNAGVVFKHNANQRYAHSFEAEAELKGLCRSLAIPWQDFAMRADMPCGSTLGPKLSAGLGLRAMDLGVASWGMHSIRETAGLADVDYLRTLLAGFFLST